MCIVFVQGTACLCLSTWHSLHVSLNYHVCPNMWCENSKLSQAGALWGWVWSARAWRPRMMGCKMLCLWTRKRLATGDGSIKKEESAVTSWCSWEYLELTMQFRAMLGTQAQGTLGCPAGSLPSFSAGNSQDCMSQAPWPSFVSA